MSTRSPSPRLGLPFLALRQVKRIGPLGTIILLHAVLLYALQSGLLRQAAQALPNEVFATFITPEPAPDLPKPQPATPKTVPVVKKTVAPPVATPVVNTTPSPQAITAAPAAPSPEPAAPAVSAVTAPPAPAAPAQPKTITTGIEYLQALRPEYPPISKRLGEQGKVILRVLVNEKGRPEQIEIQKSSGFARLDEAARQAVSRFLFKPYIDDGKAAAAFVIVPLSFQLDN